MTSFRVLATGGRPPFFINRTLVGLTPAGARLAEVDHARVSIKDIVEDGAAENLYNSRVSQTRMKPPVVIWTRTGPKHIVRAFGAICFDGGSRELEGET